MIRTQRNGLRRVLFTSRQALLVMKSAQRCVQGLPFVRPLRCLTVSVQGWGWLPKSEFIMVLERSKTLVAMGIEAAQSLIPPAERPGNLPDSHLWILSQGFFNGFYSVIDTLNKVEKHQGDALLRVAITEWLAATKENREMRMGKWRNLMTHQGRYLTTVPTVQYTPDDWHDTEFPQYGHVFATVEGEGHSTSLTFNRWALDAFLFLDRGLREIEVKYNRAKKVAERSRPTSP